MASRLATSKRASAAESSRCTDQMIRRRAAAAGIATKLASHSYRPIGIAAYRKYGRTLEKAAPRANHASTSTARL